jgi:hypothetical protein
MHVRKMKMPEMLLTCQLISMFSIAVHYSHFLLNEHPVEQREKPNGYISAIHPMLLYWYACFAIRLTTLQFKTVANRCRGLNSYSLTLPTSNSDCSIINYHLLY